jgi:plastocyanin
VFTHRRASGLLVSAAVIVAGAGCGGDDSDSTAETTAAAVTAQTEVDTTDPPPPATTAAAPETGENEIVIADFAFTGVTEVAVGTTVVVTNADPATHTFTAVDGTFDSGALSMDDTFEFTFTEAGEFAYFCNFHPSMTGTIVVTG